MDKSVHIPGAPERKATPITAQAMLEQAQVTLEQAMNEFKSWDEMSTLEQYACQYWDMYKDAHGMRPRGIDTSGWSEADFEAEFASLEAVITREEAARAEAEAAAVAKFEQHVTNTICMGAGDRSTALRWIMDASNANGDWEYLCWDLGLPHRYFIEKVMTV